MFLIVFSFGRGFRVAHRFLLWEGDPCCSLLFVLGGGSVSLIVFCFGRGISVDHRFCFGRGIRAAHCCLLWEEDPCC